MPKIGQNCQKFAETGRKGKNKCQVKKSRTFTLASISSKFPLRSAEAFIPVIPEYFFFGFSGFSYSSALSWGSHGPFPFPSTQKIGFSRSMASQKLSPFLIPENFCLCNENKWRGGDWRHTSLATEAFLPSLPFLSLWKSKNSQQKNDQEKT